MSRMLLGETQKDLASAISEYFSLTYFTVQLEDQGTRVLECLQTSNYDVILLEITLPGMNAIEIVRTYRAAGGTTPILLLSVRYSSEQLQAGLDAGADGYIIKPYSLGDLAAHVRALMRRPILRCEKVLKSGDIALNLDEGTVMKNDQAVHLFPMEYRLLRFLLAHPNQVFTQHAIFERVWQKEDGLEDTVRTHVRTLRRKIDSDGKPSIITTVRGLGYKAEIR